MQHEVLLIGLMATVLVGTASITVSAEPSFQGLGAGTTVADISGNGQVVVGRDEALSGFRWEGGTITTLLGIGGWGPGNADPLAVSYDGSVIVGGSPWLTIPIEYDPNNPPPEPGPDAYIWTEEDGAVWLQDLFANEYGFDLTGWTLVNACAISNDGLTIAGNAYHDDGLGGDPVLQGWVTHISEPTTAALLLIGLAGLVRRRRS